jgi:cytokinin dehydrogenase
MNRRGFLNGALAGAALVTAYIPSRGAWAAKPDPKDKAIKIPSLDGQLVLAGPLLQEAADDFGHIISSAPVAVLIPGSIHDVRKLIQFANKNGVKVGGMSMIGNTHSTYGQSQVAGGVVIDMSALCEIHQISATEAYVDAGVRWSELLEATLPLGKSPPTLTDYIDLSVGGTASVGGIGGQAFRHGLQVDNITELEIVTGKGKLVTCSAKKNKQLFDAARAGLGQVGIIVRARVRLIDVPPMVRVYTAYYDDLAAMTSDQELVIDDGRFDYVEGFAEPGANGWIYKIELVKYFAPQQPPADAALIGDLAFTDGTLNVADSDYFSFANRVVAVVPILQSFGLWDLPHPWFDMFVPGDQAVDFIEGVLAQTTPADVGPFPIIIYPFKRAAATAPALPLPPGENCYLFSLLRTAIPPATAAGLIAKNREIYEDLHQIGGKRYAISSVPFDQQDWKDHFGAYWPLFVGNKLEYDPKNTLTPGQGIFSW